MPRFETDTLKWAQEPSPGVMLLNAHFFLLISKDTKGLVSPSLYLVRMSRPGVAGACVRGRGGRAGRGGLSGWRDSCKHGKCPEEPSGDTSSWNLGPFAASSLTVTLRAEGHRRNETTQQVTSQSRLDRSTE